MNIGSPQWIRVIVEGAAQMGVVVDQKQAGQMAAYGQELITWNQRINLTAITDPMEVAVKHFLDSLAGLNEIPPHARLLDIGSGGGFPGLPLKILRPRQSMTLVDSIRKKVNFIKHVVRMLQLQQIDVLQCRAETLADRPDGPGSFDVVTCRALADLEVIRRLATPLLVPDGMLVIYKGPQEYPDETIPQLTYSNRQLGEANPQEFKVTYRDYRLPLLGDARRLIVMRRMVSPSE